MTVEDRWRKIADRLNRDLALVPQEQQLEHLQKAIAALPEDIQQAVENFTFIGLKIGMDANRVMTQRNRNMHISGVVVLGFALSVLIACLGIYLVTLSGDDANTNISILGSSIETDSLGLACFGVSALLFLYLTRQALSKY